MNAPAAALAPPAPATPPWHRHRERLEAILRGRDLHALFQPIVHMRDASITGYEGLIRGPSDCPLHSPLLLFQAARELGCSLEIEYLSRAIVLDAFAQRQLPGKLFLNVSPDTLLMEGWRSGETLRCVRESGLRPEQVVIELTENTPSLEYAVLREATLHYRKMGFEIAMDDLGEGFSSLRMWSEIRPDYVKVDKHFTQHINLDPVKLQFVRSIREIAVNSGCRVIAEGIETQAELVTLRDLGVDFGQGYHFAHPESRPIVRLGGGVVETLTGLDKLVHAAPSRYLRQSVTVASLVRYIPPVDTAATNDVVFSRFEQDPALYAIPVVDGQRAVGLVSRHDMIDRYVRQFRKELFGRRPCTMMMDAAPLIVERSVTLHELSSLILTMEPYHLSAGFIVTDRGSYLGMGSGHDLLRQITQMQIAAARYANPLTQLPGNVPINEQIDRLLGSRTPFVACYVDLDHFKPYNDTYGFRRGDEIIQLTAALLQRNIDPTLDFVGHIGGDDFIVLFLSTDWSTRCLTLLDQFAQGIGAFYSAADLARGGIESEDRQGNNRFFPVVSVSVGAIAVDACHYRSHYEVAAAATQAKKEAKKIPGNHLFVERRVGT